MHPARLLLLCLAAASIACSPTPQPSPLRPTPAPSARTTAAPVTPVSEQDFLRAHKTRIEESAGRDAVLRTFDAATVIGLGEQTHGSDHNAITRVAFARLLIEQRDVRTVALEADYVETLKVDAYAQGGPGEPTKLLAQQRAGWIWNKAALRDFLVWLRELNARRPEKQRVHLVGIDMQTAPVIHEALAAALAKVNADAALRATVSEMTSCTDPKFDSVVPQLLAIAETSPELAPLVNTFGQCHMAARDETPERRESYMAGNVLALTQGEARTRVVILAHNAHVAKIPLPANDTSSMGAVLAATLGSKYVAVGTILGDGDFRAYRFDPEAGRSNTTEILALGDPPEGTLEAILQDSQAFFLPLAGWPGEARKMRVVGASYAPGHAEHYFHTVRIERAFDGLFYLPHA